MCDYCRIYFVASVNYVDISGNTDAGVLYGLYNTTLHKPYSKSLVVAG